MAQTSVTSSMAVGLSGMQARMSNIDHIEPGLLDTAAANAGTYVRRIGVNARGQTLFERPDATGEVTAIASQGGILLLDTARDPSQGAAVQVGEAIGVLQNGYVLASCENAWTDGNPVCIRFAAGAGGTVLGAVRDGVVADETVALPRAYFANTGGAAGIALIRMMAIS